MSDSTIVRNAKRDPTYCPYCMRCTGLVRMKIVEPFYWRCFCGAEHDERTPVSPLPSSARSALRERVDAMIALAGDGADGMLPLAAVRDALSLAERGAEDTRILDRIEWGGDGMSRDSETAEWTYNDEATPPTDGNPYGIVRGSTLRECMRKALASSPTGGTTE